MSIPFMDQSVTSIASSSTHFEPIRHPPSYSPSSTTTSLPVWKSYLYNLQMQAPKPSPILCRTTQARRPRQYGLEFHGLLARTDADQLMSTAIDGSYLVRESLNPPDSYTLAIKFNNEVKNYKLFYDAQTSTHYVGEKHFDTLDDLVHDGLISFYLESKASDYIALMACDAQCYTNESPYGQYKAQLLHRAQAQNHTFSPIENRVRILHDRSMNNLSLSLCCSEYRPVQSGHSSLDGAFSSVPVSSDRSDDDELSVAIDTQFAHGSTSRLSHPSLDEHNDEYQSQPEESTGQSAVLRSYSHHAGREGTQFQNAFIQGPALVRLLCELSLGSRSAGCQMRRLRLRSSQALLGESATRLRK